MELLVLTHLKHLPRYCYSKATKPVVARRNVHHNGPPTNISRFHLQRVYQCLPIPVHILTLQARHTVAPVFQPHPRDDADTTSAITV